MPKYMIEASYTADGLKGVLAKFADYNVMRLTPKGEGCHGR